jgi:hypothetical protein
LIFFSFSKVQSSFDDDDDDGNCRIMGYLQRPGDYNVQLEYFRDNCGDWIIGPISQLKNIELIFNEVRSNCPVDKVIVFDNNRQIIYDYCQAKLLNIFNTRGSYTYITLRIKSFQLGSVYVKFRYNEYQQPVVTNAPSNPVQILPSNSNLN